jgi:iron complex outermembrane recepter protein
VGSFLAQLVLFLELSVRSLVSSGWKQGETMPDIAIRVSAHTSIQFIQLPQQSRGAQTFALTARARGIFSCFVFSCFAMRQGSARALLFACFVTAPVYSNAQNAATTTESSAQSTAAAKPAAQPVQPVTTTVVVHGDTKDDYLPDAISVGTLDGATLKETPLSAIVVTRDLLNDQNVRLLSEVIKNDASVGEDYAPVGYYGDYEIRGFPIDLATGLEINGMTIAGEQDVPLESVERVELLKGIAGVESGVASAGGLINFVTKRPATVKAMDLETDHRGTAYGAVDLGRLFGGRKQVGARVNLAGERIVTYVNDANGWRAAGAGAADWKLAPKAILTGDFEYQHKVERSVCGYQLLGGTTAPDLNQVYPSTMLGAQSWAPPNIFDTINTGARLDYDLSSSWHAFGAASYSHSLINDNVVYAYGCYYEAECNVPGGPAPWFFAPDGTYDIYDYRDPGELRIDAVGEAVATGKVKTGPVTHEIAFGGEVFHRTVDLPGTPSAGAPATVQDGAVYTYLGSENIFQPIVPFLIESPIQSAGPVQLADFDHQTAGIVQDRMSLPGGIRLIAGGRYASVRDFNYEGTRGQWLPQYAATYSPANALMFYSNYSVLLSLGPQAPFWAGGLYLAPFLTRQTEVGAKYQPGERILLTTALYRMRAPFFYPKQIDDEGDQNFISEGRETHDGVELNAQGNATNWLNVSASASAIRAISDDTGTPAFDNKQVLNVPHLRTAVFADIAVPHTGGLHLMPGWGYTGRKEATRDDLVSVPGYNLFNMGARYTPHGEQGRVTLRLYADNIADKRYWKDTGASYGDTFIHLGAPTTVRLSAHYTF